MDKQTIIFLVFTFIVSGIVAPFSKSFFDRIFTTYNPDPKKIVSRLKVVVLFILKYGFPIAGIIYLTIKSPIGKFYILSMCFYFFIIVFNFILDIYRKILDSFKSIVRLGIKR